MSTISLILLKKKKHIVPETGPVFGRRDKNKFLSCSATRSFISGPNRSPLFCPPEKVNRASVQTTVLSILKIWKMLLQYNLACQCQSVNTNTMSKSFCNYQTLWHKLFYFSRSWHPITVSYKTQVTVKLWYVYGR